MLVRRGSWLFALACIGFSVGAARVTAQEALVSGQHLFVEQDEFAKWLGLGGDQNYTMGVGIQLTGYFVRWSGVGNVQFAFDRLFSLTGLPLTPDYDVDETFHSLMLVGSAFTPDDITQATPVIGDRPYASFLGVTSRRVSPRGTEEEWAFSSELSVGFLGLGVSRDVQTWIHEKVNSDTPMGWGLQISDGGEPSGYYRVGIQRRLTPFFSESVEKRFEVSADGDLWMGNYTGVSLGLTARLGRIYSRYFEFGSAPLAGTSQAMIRHRDENEIFLFASSRARGVGYNALLQGQFKDNPYELDGNEIRRVIAEVEAGVHGSFGITDNYAFYITWSVLSGRSPDIDSDIARWHWWGSAQLGLTHATR